MSELDTTSFSLPFCLADLDVTWARMTTDSEGGFESEEDANDEYPLEGKFKDEADREQWVWSLVCWVLVLIGGEPSVS